MRFENVKKMLDDPTFERYCSEVMLDSLVRKKRSFDFEMRARQHDNAKFLYQ